MGDGRDGGLGMVQACQAAGITHLLMVRHANAAPLPSDTPARVDQPHHWKRDDQMRVLTQKGKEQCEKAAPWLGAVPVRCMLSSPARRASETAVGMAYAGGLTCEVRMVEGIHPAGRSEVCEYLFEHLGYGPLRKFFEVEHGEQGFRDYGDAVCKEMMAQSSFFAQGQGTCVAIFGHAVFLNAIVYEIIKAAAASDTTINQLLDMDLGETEGILIDLALGGIAKKTANPLGGQAVVASCQGADITQVLLVRHANAAPLASETPARKDQPHHWKRDDQMRVLTDKGREQCAAASEWFTSIPVRTMISSPARRASETAVNMAAQIETEEQKVDTLGLRMVESVHPAGMSEICETLFETLGYGPLRKFYEAEGGEAAFRDYGDRVCLDIAAQTTFLGEGVGSCLAVFGHAVFLNAIALEICLASGCGMESVEQLLDLDLGETQGILVDLASNGSIKIMSA
eukprot:gb/GFBE01005782.1/.p1 GENE.gb/GFBE01005782.1/~~gb/GFBE01005782.1/.p1  ORF type:complete len:457 (+),score=64.85 gb/GFBE01005782.1/:1-1371(+)